MSRVPYESGTQRIEMSVPNLCYFPNGEKRLILVFEDLEEAARSALDAADDAGRDLSIGHAAMAIRVSVYRDDTLQLSIAGISGGHGDRKDAPKPRPI